MSRPTPLLCDDRGTGAAEFALVLPLLLMLLFGVIDGGRFLWEYNRAEKATQVGARMAVVTDPVPANLAGFSFVGVNGLTDGEAIRTSDFATVTCTSAACSPATYGNRNPAAFQQIVDRMRAIKADIAPANVEVVYAPSGAPGGIMLGYAGDPSGIDAAPLVTVRLRDMQFRPITSLMLGTIAMPSFATTLPAEDSVGKQSN